MDDLKQSWNNVMELIKPEVTSTSYSTWFLPLVPKKFDDRLNILYIEGNNDLLIDIIKNRYLDLIENTVERVYKKKCKVVVNMESEEDEEAKEIEEQRTIIKTDYDNEFILNPNWNFDNFVVGDNNRFAHAVALAVAEAPAETYNPLFIYGKSGLGKSHLMHAIGHYVLEHHPRLKVLYVSSEMFTNELIKALGDKKNRKGIRAFKNKYRNIDVFLIDDIQFIEGKESTQDEFFHTFNTLYDLNKQIIISSDRSPDKLVNLDERLRSRFAWNITADIQPPEYETRVAILRNKAQLENVEIDDNLLEVIDFIAEKIKFNVRELEGAFTNVISLCTLMNQKITLKIARETLKNRIPTGDFNITCETIKKEVCKKFNIKLSDIESGNRKRAFTYPRQIAMYLCRQLTDTSLPKIGEAFGGKDHTTVLHACEKISTEIKSNIETKDAVEELENLINQK